jgi:hypothetical protein
MSDDNIEIEKLMREAAKLGKTRVPPASTIDREAEPLQGDG